MINLTKKDFIAMKKNEFVTNESHMCIDPNNKNKIIKIIKKFKNEPEFFKMKMYTIKLLLANIDILRVLNVAIPEEIVSNLYHCPLGSNLRYTSYPSAPATDFHLIVFLPMKFCVILVIFGVEG